MSDENQLQYTASDGKSKFVFELRKRANGCWRIYILQQPKYGRRPADVHTTHRLTDDLRPYVCWEGHIQTMGQAVAVARLWADKTAQYIATGRRF